MLLDRQGLCGQGAASGGCWFWQRLTPVQIYILNLLFNCVNEESAQLCATRLRHAVLLAFGRRSPEGFGDIWDPLPSQHGRRNPEECRDILDPLPSQHVLVTNQPGLSCYLQLRNQ